MNKYFLSLTLLLSISVTVGCTSKGFNRGALIDLIAVKKPVVTDSEIKEALNKKSNLPKPFKLALYFKRPPQNLVAKSNWRWTDDDRAIVLSSLKEIQNKNGASEIFPILSTLVEDEDLKSIRLAAAKQGADAVLIVGGAAEIDRYINNLGWTYIFLVPMAFVRGTEVDTLFISNATLWDVRNEFLYLTAEAEGKFRSTQTALFGEKDQVLYEKAKADSMNNLKNELSRMIKGMK